MNKDKKIIIGLIVILVVLVVGRVAFYIGKNSKEDNKLPIVENNLPPENQVVNNNQQKDSCLVITSPLANQAVSFPLTISGYINLKGLESNTCTWWGASEGTAGEVVAKDMSGNVKSSTTKIKTVGDYFNGMQRWPIEATVQKLTGASSLNTISLYMNTSKEEEPNVIITKIIQPLNVVFEKPTTINLKIFFPNSIMDPGFTNCNVVHSVLRTVPYTLAVGEASLKELVKGPTDLEKSQGYQTLIDSNTTIKSLSIENGVAYVNFSKALQNKNSGLCAGQFIQAQIGETLLQFPTVGDVVVSIEGNTNFVKP